MRNYIIEGIRSFGITNFFMVLNFIGNLLLIRLLSPEIFGLFALSLAIVGIVEIFTTFSINTIYLQRKPNKFLFNGIKKIIFFILLLKLSVAFLVYILLSNVYDSYVWKIFIIIFIFKLCIPINSLLISILEKNLLFFKASLITNFANFFAIILSIMLVTNYSFGIEALIIKEVFPIFFIFVSSIISSRKFLFSSSRVSKSYMKLLLLKALEMYWVRFSELSFSRIPLLMMENIFGPAILGFYTQSLYLVNTLNRISNSINQQIGIVFFSNFRNDKKLKNKGAKMLYLISFIVGAPVSILLYLFNYEVISILFGEKWIDASGLVKYMSPLVLMLPVFTILKSQLFGNRENLKVAFTYLAGTLVFAIGLLIFKDTGNYLYSGYLTILAFLIMIFLSACFVLRSSFDERN